MMCKFNDLLGLKLYNIDVVRDDSEKYDEIVFWSTCGKQFKMYHDQKCCEEVNLEDICGELDDLIGERIVLALESTEHGDGEKEDYMWTFYRLGTVKGSVVIRWSGESERYSVKVDFIKVDELKNEID